MTSSKKVHQTRALREKVSKKIRMWSSKDQVFQHMIELFNYTRHPAFIIYHDEDADEVLPRLKLLDGPHGHTIYKIMLERQNVSVHD